jgi:hypothetical protein
MLDDENFDWLAAQLEQGAVKSDLANLAFYEFRKKFNYLFNKSNE